METRRNTLPTVISGPAGCPPGSCCPQETCRAAARREPRVFV